MSTPIRTLLAVAGLILLVTAATAISQPRICYFGDSITEGWIEAELRPRFAYPALTDSLLRTQALPTVSITRGFGGETTDDAIRRLDSDVLSQQPDVTTVSFGSNDRYVWGTEPSVRVAVDRFADNLRLIVRKLLGSGSRVILLGLPPVDASRFHRYADSLDYIQYGGIKELQHRYDSVIASTAQEMHCTYLSLKTVFTQPLSQLGFDGVHPTQEGHRVIAEQLTHAIMQALNQQVPLRESIPVTVFPNPFRPRNHSWCSIRFPAQNGDRFVLLIAGADGRTVRKIVYCAYSDGHHIVPWDGRTQQGTCAAPGAYIVYIASDKNVDQRNILLM